MREHFEIRSTNTKPDFVINIENPENKMFSVRAFIDADAVRELTNGGTESDLRAYSAENGAAIRQVAMQLMKAKGLDWETADFIILAASDFKTVR